MNVDLLFIRENVEQKKEKNEWKRDTVNTQDFLHVQMLERRDQDRFLKQHNRNEKDKRFWCFGNNWIIHPESIFYIIWGILLRIIIIISSLTTPFMFGFDISDEGGWLVINIIIEFMYIVDIIIRFFVTYKDEENQMTVYDKKLIAFHYLKTKFIIDLISAFPLDFILQGAMENRLGFQIGHLLKLFKLYRIPFNKAVLLKIKYIFIY